MKVTLRVLIGIVALIVIVLVVKQFTKGAREQPGTFTAPRPQKIGELFTSTENGYSHRIPQGWESKAAPSSPAAMIGAPESSSLSSNMVTTVERYDGTLRAYVDTKIQSLKKSASKTKVISAEFTTDNGALAYKMKLQSKEMDVDVAQTIYFFDGPGDKKITVTCTAPAKFESGLEPLFDACMRTFALSAR